MDGLPIPKPSCKFKELGYFALEVLDIPSHSGAGQKFLRDAKTAQEPLSAFLDLPFSVLVKGVILCREGLESLLKLQFNQPPNYMLQVLEINSPFEKRLT